ncbi:DUF2637 domain-containing protein [Streptomyces sp. PA03-6a]|nr:DUF2637 domain-containing protein [Streptomyces sp. PA03-6a]
MNARQGLASAAGAVTVTLTAAAFWLSYEHLHDVAASNGLGHSAGRAWAWPGTVDLFIVAGELLILRAALRGKADWFAYFLAGVGSLGSIALNVAGVGAGAEPLEYIVAAVPPVAALLAFAAVMRQVHERLADDEGKPDVVSLAPVVEQVDLMRLPVPEVAPRVPRALPPAVPQTVPAGVSLLPIVARPEVAPAPTPVAAAGVPRNGVTAPVGKPRTGRAKPLPAKAGEDALTGRARAKFADVLAGGEVPGVGTLRSEYRIGQVRAQRIRDELRSTP